MCPDGISAASLETVISTWFFAGRRGEQQHVPAASLNNLFYKNVNDNYLRLVKAAAHSLTPLNFIHLLATGPYSCECDNIDFDANIAG